MTDLYLLCAECAGPFITTNKLSEYKACFRHDPCPLLLALGNIPPGTFHVTEHVPLHHASHVVHHLSICEQGPNIPHSQLAFLTLVFSPVKSSVTMNHHHTFSTHRIWSTPSHRHLVFQYWYHTAGVPVGVQITLTMASGIRVIQPGTERHQCLGLVTD